MISRVASYYVSSGLLEREARLSYKVDVNNRRSISALVLSKREVNLASYGWMDKK